MSRRAKKNKRDKRRSLGRSRSAERTRPVRDSNDPAAEKESKQVDTAPPKDAEPAPVGPTGSSPRAFWRGFAFAWAVPIPLVAVAAAGASSLESIPALAGPGRAALLAFAFAGIPTALAFGGMCRVAYRDSVLREPPRHIARRAAVRSVPAGMGAAILASIPAGIVFESPAKWLWIAGTGGVIGVLSGALLGAWVRHWALTVAQLPHGDGPNDL